MTEQRIYLSPPSVGDVEMEYAREALESNWIAPLGPHVDAFESELAGTCRVGHAAALASGTAALHLALLLSGATPGDEILCPTLTFVATANPIVYVGARPVFIDSDSATWTVDPDLLEEELTASRRRGSIPRAVITVDLYGQCADYARIESLCAEFGVAIIEDASQALGATAFGRPAGSFGDLGVLSFNGNKIITTSGGGALLSNSAETMQRARFLASQAREPAAHYEHSEIGYNYRMSNIAAAIGRGQLTTLDERVRARRSIFDRYQAGLGDMPGIAFMPEADYGMTNRWLTTLTIDPTQFGATREDVRLALADQNMEARPIWKPMHLQSLYAEARIIGGEVAALLFETGLCLPSGSALTSAEVERIISIVHAAARL